MAMHARRRWTPSTCPSGKRNANPGELATARCPTVLTMPRERAKPSVTPDASILKTPRLATGRGKISHERRRARAGSARREETPLVHSGGKNQPPPRTDSPPAAAVDRQGVLPLTAQPQTMLPREAAIAAARSTRQTNLLRSMAAACSGRGSFRPPVTGRRATGSSGLQPAITRKADISSGGGGGRSGGLGGRSTLENPGKTPITRSPALHLPGGGL